jgi:uncharacterized protein
MFERSAKVRVNELLDEFRVVYIAGPRQSGKTTLSKVLAFERGMTYISLDNDTALASATSDPLGFIESFGSQTVVIDEFQYLPELVRVIKLVSDRLPLGQRGKFLLTGSADVFSSAKIQESLPGHMARVELYPLSIAEKTGSRANLIDFLFDGTSIEQSPKLNSVSRLQLSHWILQGGFPELQGKSTRSHSAWYRSYVRGRLFKDFESLYAARGEYQGKLKALIPHLAGLNSQLLKYASVANDLALNDKVVKSYIQALEWMFILKRIAPFIKNSAKRETLGMPKIHLIDTGLACHLLHISTSERLLASTMYGPMLENLVVMEMFKHSVWAKRDVALMHFRDTQRREVDLVLKDGNGDLVGIEVKASASVSEQDFSGLRAFADFTRTQFKRGFIFYSGDKILPFRIARDQFYAIPLSLLS